VDVATKEVVTVAKAEIGEIMTFVWSPDSRWIAYAKPEAVGMPKVYLYSLESKKTIEATDGWYSSHDPCFSADGKYLFFVSDRDFNPSSAGPSTTTSTAPCPGSISSPWPTTQIGPSSRRAMRWR